MKTLKITILLIVTVTMSMTAQISVNPQNTATNRVSYENKPYTVRLGKVVNNGQGSVTVEILTDEKIEIPVKNGTYVVPIMAKIEAGGRTFITDDNVMISDNSLLFNFGVMPDKVIVYGNDGNSYGQTVTFYVVNNTANVRQPQPVYQPQSQAKHTATGQYQNAQQAATNNVLSQTVSNENNLKTRWGIKGGLNVATITFENVDNSGIEPVAGAVAGITLEHPFTPKWFFHSGLEFSVKGFEISSGSSTIIKSTAIYLQFPATIGYKFNIGNGWKLEPQLGLYFAYGISGDTSATDSKNSGSVKTFNDKILNPFDCGTLTGVFFYKNNFVIGIHGELGFTEANGDNFKVTGTKVYSSNVSLTLGCLF